MIDRQPQPSTPLARIPFLSAVLHCIAMTVIVYLRFSFGFTYLRPRSVFFVFSWAFVLFFIYSWIEPGVWPEYRGVCLYGMGAVLLYLVNFVWAFFSELYEKGEREYYSGTSYPIRLMRLAGWFPSARLEMNWHIWVEPGLVLLAAAVLRLLFGERHLSTWLFVVAPCFCFKECLNYWFRIRQKKRGAEAIKEAEEQINTPANNADVAAPKAARKQNVKQQRAGTMSAAEELQERRFAALLEMEPPFSLEQAEQNYRRLIKDCHPDPNDDSAENNRQTAELNDAVEFFRARSWE